MVVGKITQIKLLVKNHFGDEQNETNNFGFDYSTDVTQYFQCSSNTSFELRLYVAYGMGHSWPQFADEQIWDFFMQIATWPLDISEHNTENKSLVNIVDLLGRETIEQGLHVKIFSNGTREKIYRIK